MQHEKEIKEDMFCSLKLTKYLSSITSQLIRTDLNFEQYDQWSWIMCNLMNAIIAVTKASWGTVNSISCLHIGLFTHDKALGVFLISQPCVCGN